MLKGQTPAQDKIKKEQFENLCNLWCTLTEIAEFFGVSEDSVELWCKKTYNERFTDIYKKKNSKGKIALRRWQMKSAEKGNVTMQIWLGKQYLGQKEKIEYNDDNINNINKNISNIAELLNKPVENRTEDNISE